jgi:hypothetical protein
MSEKNKKQKKDDLKKKNKKEDILPQRNIDTSSPTPGSMSEGNLSNNRYGRERSRSLHEKTFVMGTDDDGQAD